jgi:alkylated DNA repair dioxygenase AlkB
VNVKKLCETFNKVGVAHVVGLCYFPEFVTAEEADYLLDRVNRGEWRNDLRKRRVQQYGYKYDYFKRTLSEQPGIFPKWLKVFADDLEERGVFDIAPDQVIANEYLPGQGINMHVDSVDSFGHIVTSLTLGSGTVMELSKGDERYQIYLEPNSLLVLSGAARYAWRHGIKGQRSDVIDGVELPRQRRVSITCRNAALTPH